jgi:hypothetical protein
MLTSCQRKELAHRGIVAPGDSQKQALVFEVLEVLEVFAVSGTSQRAATCELHSGVMWVTVSFLFSSPARLKKLKLFLIPNPNDQAKQQQ